MHFQYYDISFDYNQCTVIRVSQITMSLGFMILILKKRVAHRRAKYKYFILPKS
jgi:hypothetical protein